MKGGNGASAVSEVTLCSNHAYQNDAAKNASGSRTKSAKKFKPQRTQRAQRNGIYALFESRIPKRRSPKPFLDRGCLSRRRILSRKERKERKEIFKISRTSSAAPHLRVRFSRAAGDCRVPAHPCACAGQTFCSPSGECVIPLPMVAPLPPSISL